jgi:hypothetical protein
VKYFALAGIFLLCVVAAAQDAQLAAISKTVLALRDYGKAHPNFRGAVPEVTVAKHQIRDWIESKLASFAEHGDELGLANDLQSPFSAAKLFCDDPTDCIPTSLGFLDVIQVNRDHDFLIFTTAVGVAIRCGYDNSAYIYEWKAGKWQRVWESERNDYSSEDVYHPQIVHSVHISEPAADGTRLILTLGTPTGCGGAFVPLYYRLWRTGASAPSLILDKSELINDESEPPAIGKLTADDLLIEFSAGGTGYGDTHKALRHFEIHGAAVTQTDPIAPTARDFAEEWLAAAWKESATRADSPALGQWHAKVHREDGQGDYPEPALSCTSDPSLVEITTHFEGLPKYYFLVRTKTPLHFSMANVSDWPFTDCTKPDPDADRQPSLMPANQ